MIIPSSSFNVDEEEAEVVNDGGHDRAARGALEAPSCNLPHDGVDEA
jgi:hypothetical protein